MQSKIKIGLVARCDDSGLGRMSLDFYENMQFEKVMVVSSSYKNDYQRYEGANVVVCERGIPSLHEISEFLDGLDMVLTIETPYNFNIFSEAKKRGVKTAMIVMYEWTNLREEMPFEPDLFICPTQLDYDTLWGNKVLIPTPVDRKKIPFRLRKQARTFVFNNGHGGYANRNSLMEFLQAIPLVKSDVKFIIRSQVLFDSINDSRTQVEIGETPFERLWADGDIYVHTHKFDGLSLPIQEAMAAGMPTMAVRRPPYDQVLPKDFLFDGEYTAKIKLHFREVEATFLNSRKIAAKIDEIAAFPEEVIVKASQEMNRLAEEISWEKLKPVYEECFEALVHAK